MKGNQRANHRNRRNEIHIPDELIERILNDVAPRTEAAIDESATIVFSREEYDVLQYRSAVLDMLGFLVALDHGDAAIDLLDAIFDDDDEDGGEEDA